MSSSPAVYFFSFLLAFCSLFYELVYAEILSVCLGGTKIQYITTISLFTCALGLGSITFKKFSAPETLRRNFFTVELLLMILGGLGPFFITWILQPGGTPGLAPLKMIASYSVIFIIGFLSGFELPFLFSLKEKAEGKILAMDYLGMLAASVSFPLLFLPSLGAAASTLLISLTNGAALIWLRPGEKRSTNVTVIFSVLLIAMMIFMLGQRAHLNNFLSVLYLGGKA
jgi:spermidine synthase